MGLWRDGATRALGNSCGGVLAMRAQSLPRIAASCCAGCDGDRNSCRVASAVEGRGGTLDLDGRQFV